MPKAAAPSSVTLSWEEHGGEIQTEIVFCSRKINNSISCVVVFATPLYEDSFGMSQSPTVFSDHNKSFLRCSSTVHTSTVHTVQPSTMHTSHVHVNTVRGGNIAVTISAVREVNSLLVFLMKRFL